MHILKKFALRLGKKERRPGGSPNSRRNNEHSEKALYVLSFSFIVFSLFFIFLHFLSFLSFSFFHFLSFSFILFPFSFLFFLFFFFLGCSKFFFCLDCLTISYSSSCVKKINFLGRLGGGTPLGLFFLLSIFHCLFIFVFFFNFFPCFPFFSFVFPFFIFYSFIFLLFSFLKNVSFHVVSLFSFLGCSKICGCTSGFLGEKCTF